MEKPKVSICIPNYNYAQYLDECIQSAINQSYDNIEIIVSDNCSTDDSLNVLSKYQNRVKVYQNNVNVGIADNHNIAAKYGAGEYFVLLSSDDILKPDFVAKTLDIFLKFEDSRQYDIGMVMTEKDTIDEQGNISDFTPFYASDFVCKGESHAKVSMMGNPTPPSFCLLKKSAFLKTQGFQKIYGTAHDWGFMFDMNMVSDVGYIHEKLGLYRVHGNISTTSVENFRYICNIHTLKLDMADRVKGNEYLFGYAEESVKRTASQALKWAVETLKNGKFDISRKYLSLVILFDESFSDNAVYKKVLEVLNTNDPLRNYLEAEKAVPAVKPRTEPYPFPKEALIVNKKAISEYLYNYKGEKIVMFGASNNALMLMEEFQIDNILCFCDNDANKHGKKFNNLYDIISPDELMSIKEPVYIIISSMYFSDIIKQLIGLDFRGNIDNSIAIQDKKIMKETPGRFEDGKARIDDVLDLLCDDKSKKTYKEVIEIRLSLTNNLDFSKVLANENLYFNKSIFEFSENEVYVDAGAIGSSSLDFINVVNGKFKKIYCFEPDVEGFDALCRTYEQRNIPKDKYQIFNAGIYSETKIAKFSKLSSGNHSNFITECGISSLKTYPIAELLNVQLYKLDDIIDSEVTLIKMDIEGSELEAIKGSEKIIEKYKPKLAICLYHKITDFWEIPLEIHRICPEYKIYIRHHADSVLDTVLYACV